MASSPKSNMPKRILVVDDDYTVGQGLETPFKPYEIQISNAQDLDNALRLFNEADSPIVLVELEFEPMHGLALIQRWRASEQIEKRATVFILMTGKTRPVTDDALVRELADIEMIVKPLKPINVLPYISRAMGKYQMLLSFEHFRKTILEQAANTNQIGPIADSVKKRLPEFQTRGIELLCELYEASENYELALQFVNGMLAKDNNNPFFLNAKGRLLLKMGKEQDARDPLEKAYKASPTHLGRLNTMEDMYLKLKDPEKALEKMEERLKFSRGDDTVKFNMFTKLHDHGFQDYARKLAKNHANPMEIVRYYNNKGVGLSQSGDIQSAIKEYERALSYFPTSKENYRIYYNIALAKIKTKNEISYKEAVGNLRKCLELAPEFDKARNTLDILTKAMKKEAS